MQLWVDILTVNVAEFWIQLHFFNQYQKDRFECAYNWGGHKKEEDFIWILINLIQRRCIIEGSLGEVWL